MSGDYNQDGSVNILDVVSIVDLIIDGSFDYNECIDVNDDESVDVMDVVILIDQIIN